MFPGAKLLGVAQDPMMDENLSKEVSIDESTNMAHIARIYEHAGIFARSYGICGIRFTVCILPYGGL